MEEFSRRLKRLRLENDLLQSDLSSRLHISQAMVSAYENGREPPFDTLLSIARYFGVSVDYLMGLSQDRMPARGDLAEAVSRTASLASSAGAPPVTVSAISHAAASVTAAIARDSEAGAQCAALAAALVASVDSLAAAVASGSASRVLDASAEAMAAVLKIQSVTAAFFREKTENV